MVMYLILVLFLKLLLKYYSDSVTLNQLAPEEGLGLQQDGQFDPSKYPVPENPYKELLIFYILLTFLNKTSIHILNKF